MKLLISVVVPVYNAAQYLEDCVGSVLRQTYPHFELILADDGSQDESGEVCKKMREEDSRIRFLQLEHKGVAAARNAAMKAAKGAYLLFLDSDDAIHPALLEEMAKLAEESSAGVLLEEYCIVEAHELQGRLARDGQFPGKGEHLFLDERKAMEEFSAVPTNIPRFRAIGGKMVLRDLALSVLFDERVAKGEDTLFLYRILAKGVNAALLREKWYYYRQHGDNFRKKGSIAACQNSYDVERYICDQEAEHGRMKNALCWERLIVEFMTDRYEIGRRAKDRQLQAYLRALARKERRLPIYAKLSQYHRAKFQLAFHSYPLYWMMNVWLAWLNGYREKRRMKNG